MPVDSRVCRFTLQIWVPNDSWHDVVVQVGSSCHIVNGRQSSGEWSLPGIGNYQESATGVAAACDLPQGPTPQIAADATAWPCGPMLDLPPISAPVTMTHTCGADWMSSWAGVLLQQAGAEAPGAEAQKATRSVVMLPPVWPLPMSSPMVSTTAAMPSAAGESPSCTPRTMSLQFVTMSDPCRCTSRCRLPAQRGSGAPSFAAANCQLAVLQSHRSRFQSPHSVTTPHDTSIMHSYGACGECCAWPK